MVRIMHFWSTWASDWGRPSKRFCDTDHTLYVRLSRHIVSAVAEPCFSSACSYDSWVKRLCSNNRPARHTRTQHDQWCPNLPPNIETTKPPYIFSHQGASSRERNIEMMNGLTNHSHFLNPRLPLHVLYTGAIHRILLAQGFLIIHFEPILLSTQIGMVSKLRMQLLQTSPWARRARIWAKIIVVVGLAQTAIRERSRKKQMLAFPSQSRRETRSCSV